MDQRKIERINELARKAKTPEGLTDGEKAERDALRREYVNAVTGGLKAQLESIYLVDEHGGKRKLTRRGEGEKEPK